MIPTTDKLMQYLLWAPLAVAALHMCEEFVLPGGFMAWYRAYRGPAVTSITQRFLIIINAVLLAVCLNIALSARDPNDPALWLGICAILCSNAVWHIWAAIRSRSYSPGIVTGVLLYIPLAVYGCMHLLRTGEISISKALLAAAIGGSYPLWSETFHRQSSSSNSASQPSQLPSK